MLSYDEDSLVCDLAETYNVYDMRSLPPMTVATFCAGLRGDSRIMQKASGAKADQETIIGAIIADRLGMIIRQLGGDVQESISALFYDDYEKPKSNNNTMAFDSIEEFNKARYGG